MAFRADQKRDPHGKWTKEDFLKAAAHALEKGHIDASTHTRLKTAADLHGKSKADGGENYHPAVVAKSLRSKARRFEKYQSQHADNPNAPASAHRNSAKAALELDKVHDKPSPRAESLEPKPEIQAEQARQAAKSGKKPAKSGADVRRSYVKNTAEKGKEQPKAALHTKRDGKTHVNFHEFPPIPVTDRSHGKKVADSLNSDHDLKRLLAEQASTRAARDKAYNGSHTPERGQELNRLDAKLDKTKKAIRTRKEAVVAAHAPNDEQVFNRVAKKNTVGTSNASTSVTNSASREDADAAARHLNAKSPGKYEVREASGANKGKFVVVEKPTQAAAQPGRPSATQHTPGESKGPGYFEVHTTPTKSGGEVQVHVANANDHEHAVKTVENSTGRYPVSVRPIISPEDNHTRTEVIQGDGIVSKSLTKEIARLKAIDQPDARVTQRIAQLEGELKKHSPKA